MPGFQFRIDRYAVCGYLWLVNRPHSDTYHLILFYLDMHVFEVVIETDMQLGLDIISECKGSA